MVRLENGSTSRLMFRLAVHENKKYAVETKIKCLSDSFRSEEKEMFTLVQLIPENYKKIIDLLISKYNELNALQTIYFVKLESPDPAHDAKSCRSAFLKIKSLVANLDALCDKTSIYAAHIRKIIITKFPEKII